MTSNKCLTLLADSPKIYKPIMKTASLTDDLMYKEGKPNVQMILDTEFTKEIRIIFQKNQVMKEHSAPYPIVVELFEGSLDFGVNGEVIHLKKGDLITLAANVPHDLTAHEACIVRLTLSKLDKVQRVEKVSDNV